MIDLALSVEHHLNIDRNGYKSRDHLNGEECTHVVVIMDPNCAGTTLLLTTVIFVYFATFEHQDNFFHDVSADVLDASFHRNMIQIGIGIRRVRMIKKLKMREMTRIQRRTGS